MPVVKLHVDEETYARLADQAVVERRPIVWQAEVALRRAVGLPFPSSTALPVLADPEAHDASD